jgi:serine/threonine protein kinase
VFTTDALATALPNRYTIERLIGEGGMARVFLARDLRHNRRVALPGLSESDEANREPQLPESPRRPSLRLGAVVRV